MIRHAVALLHQESIDMSPFMASHGTQPANNKNASKTQVKGGKSARILKCTDQLANNLKDAAGVRNIVKVILDKEVTLFV